MRKERESNKSIAPHEMRGEFPGGGKWEIVRDGQEDIGDGDRVRVEGKIFLPCEKNGYLKKDIRFEQRVEILKESLMFVWGGESGEFENMRYRNFHIPADTWRGAFKEAQEKIAAEAKKLQAALDKRAKALVDAEF